MNLTGETKDIITAINNIANDEYKDNTEVYIKNLAEALKRMMESFKS